MAARYHARFESLPTLYLKGSEYMLKVSIPDSKAKIEQTSRSAWIREAVLEKLEREGHRNNKVLEGK